MDQKRRDMHDHLCPLRRDAHRIVEVAVTQVPLPNTVLVVVRGAGS